MHDYQPSSGQENNPAWVNWVVLGLVIGLVYLVFHVRPFGRSGPTPHPAVRRPLPSFSLKGISGNEAMVTLRDVEGKVVLVIFSGTWTPDGLDLLVRLSGLAEVSVEGDSVRFFPVLCAKPGQKETLKELRAQAQRLREEFRWTIPLYADPGGMTRSGLDVLRHAAGDRTRLTYPTTVLLDRRGLVRGLWEGYRPDFEDQIRRTVMETLQE